MVSFVPLVIQKKLVEKQQMENKILAFHLEKIMLFFASKPQNKFHETITVNKQFNHSGRSISWLAKDLYF
jgi:hypothetical protein